MNKSSNKKTLSQIQDTDDNLLNSEGTPKKLKSQTEYQIFLTPPSPVLPNMSNSEKTQSLNDLFSELKEAVSPNRPTPAGASPIKPKVHPVKFTYYHYKKFLVAIGATGKGTWHIHRFFKGEKTIGGIKNTFQNAFFFSDTSHARFLKKCAYEKDPSLSFGGGTWVLLAGRDTQDEFIQASESLEQLWATLKPFLTEFPSLEEPRGNSVKVDIENFEITHEQFMEFVVIYNNTIRSDTL